MLNFRTYGYDPLTALLLAETDDCIVYAQRDNAGVSTVSEEVARGFAEEYQRYIHYQITGAFGPIRHMTTKRKVTILLADIQDFYDPAPGGRGDFNLGFFNGVDMLSYPGSNMRDMLYIDTNPGLGNGLAQLYDCVAHELQHLINFSNTYMINGGHQIDTWINEGLSTAAELIYGRSNDAAYYINTIYNKDPYGTIRYGNNFFVWNGSWENAPSYDTISNYATAYLFFQWLRIQANNGSGIYKDIIANAGAGITDYRALVMAARQRIPDLSLTSDTDWEPLLRTWMVANLIQSSDGVTGYKNRINEIAQGQASELTLHGFANTGNQMNYFYPGEGIFSAMSGSYTPSGGSGSHIRYVGIASSGSIDFTGGTYTGDVLLTFNANSTISGTSESGYLVKQGLDSGLSGLPPTLSLKQSGGADKSGIPLRYGKKGMDTRPLYPPPEWTGVSSDE
jgi:hypothetical protein